MRDFRELKMWQKTHTLTLTVYRVTACFPNDERFGLSSQMRRAAVSIEANIAEGCGRAGHADFARFLEIGMGSASELECHPPTCT
jgi:four helix bundle protein